MAMLPLFSSCHSIPGRDGSLTLINEIHQSIRFLRSSSFAILIPSLKSTQREIFFADMMLLTQSGKIYFQGAALGQHGVRRCIANNRKIH